MGRTPQNERPTLILAANNGGQKGSAAGITATDLAGIDMARIPQELAGYVPAPTAAWRRGTCSPAVDTPEGRQALCFGTADELRPMAMQWRGGVPINSARTLWVVTVRG